MMQHKSDPKIWCAGLLLATLLSLSPFCQATPAAELESIHFLIPGGQGGGWDTTAREAGKTLMDSGIIRHIDFENISGGGGARALLDLISDPSRHQNTLMVQSTPLIFRKLNRVLPYGYRDLTLISIMIAEYQTIAVPTQSPYTSLEDLLNAIRSSRIPHPILGGSSLGSLDHITLAMVTAAAGIESKTVRYSPSDGGGDALDRLLNKHLGVALVTGIGEVIEPYVQGKVRLLGVSSANRLKKFPSVPTFHEQGIDVVFSNWRGFFAAPGISAEKKQQFQRALKQLNESRLWQEKRHAFGWEELFLQDAAMRKFLDQQESEIKAVLDKLSL